MPREPLDEISDEPEDDAPAYVPPPPLSDAARAADEAQEWARACKVLHGCQSSGEAAVRAVETALDGRMYLRWCAENLPAISRNT